MWKRPHEKTLKIWAVFIKWSKKKHRREKLNRSQQFIQYA